MAVAIQTSRCGRSDVWLPLGEDIWVIDSELSIQMFNHSGKSTSNWSWEGCAFIEEVPIWAPFIGNVFSP